MNNINFQHPGGFPLETETLDAMQGAYSLLNALGEIVGEKAIIKGCKTIGTSVTDGVIYWNGELLEFRGGQAQTKIIIIDEPTSVEFEDGDLKEVYHTRYATFGTGISAVNWSEFARAYPLTSALYVGKIDMFAGDISTIPAGWFLCDGQNGTPDLRGQFIVGYDPTNSDYDAIGKNGGQNEVVLTESQTPIHSHTGTTVQGGSHSHNYTRLKRTNYRGKTQSHTGYKVEGPDITNQTASAGAHAHTFTTNEVGGNQAHENRPPFFTMALIQFKGI